MARRLPLVELDGGPREWGLQHGRAAKREVEHNVRAYLRRFTEWARIPRDEVRRRADAYRTVIEEANPDYARCMEGIAEGSGQDVADVVAVNVRYEMMYSEFADRGMKGPMAPAASGGCTSFALLPALAANGHLLMGQNWDWIPESQGLLLRTRTEDGMRGVAFTEAGIAGAKIGFNDAGVGLAVNGLVSSADSWANLRRPFHVRCWEALRARTLSEAERAVAGGTRACSSNFLIAHAGRDPQVMDIEAAPEAVCRILPTVGFLAHTNHFSDPEALGVWQPLGDDRKSTLHRLARMQAMLADAATKGKVGVEDLKRMLRDHDGRPNSVCRHPDEAFPPDDRYETVVSVVMDLDAREMSVASGNPCAARYKRVELESGTSSG